ncbi:MAG: CAP domain-containing protein [Acidimicrobiia bacterium]|nr:CAP domain-containing protein [Acidimicrobiia bacterium]
MRSLVLAAALAVTAALAVGAAMTIDAAQPSPAGYVDAGSSWAVAVPTTSGTSTTLADVEIKGIPLTQGTEPALRTPTETSASATTQAPRAPTPPTTAAPTTTSPSAPSTTPAPTTTTPPTTAAEPYFDYSYASSLVSLANSSRAAQGLAALTWSDTLASAASSGAVRMADAGSLSHSNLQPLLGPFSTVGENIGRGYTEPAAIHAAWMGSGSHRDNLLKPAFTQVGIAVWVDASGQPWVSQIFGG